MFQFDNYYSSLP